MRNFFVFLATYMVEANKAGQDSSEPLGEIFHEHALHKWTNDVSTFTIGDATNSRSHQRAGRPSGC
jgi:hypothetical protein